MGGQGRLTRSGTPTLPLVSRKPPIFSLKSDVRNSCRVRKLGERINQTDFVIYLGAFQPSEHRNSPRALR